MATSPPPSHESPSPVILRVENLERSYKMGQEIVHALAGISFDIRAGEFVGIVGPSGSGKSSLLYLLGGLDRPSKGRIWLQGKDMSKARGSELARLRGRLIGFVFQSFNLLGSLSALENVIFPMIFAGIPPKKRSERAKQLLQMVGLEKRMHHKPTELSGGQQQRVAIARALANDPPVIIADEPTGNLDSKSGVEVMALLSMLHREQNRTIILVTHDPTWLESTTRQITLRDGIIVSDHGGQKT